MSLSAGRKISYRLMAGSERRDATVISSGSDGGVLSISQEKEAGLTVGQQIIISEDIVDHYFEVTAVESDIALLTRMGRERREYFRVDDVFPVSYTRVRDDDGLRKARVYPGYDAGITGVDVPDDMTSPHLWKVLCGINAKLALLLDKLSLDEEGFTRAGDQRVNVSATGIRFVVNEHVEVGDTVEVKMLLPTTPPVGVLTYGDVVRVKNIGDKEHEIAIHFCDMDDEVRDEIIQYTLQRQRQIIKVKRQQSGNNV